VSGSAKQPTQDEILLGDCLELLPCFVDGSFQLIYIDPLFNTGREQTRRTVQAVPDEHGDRTGFQGRRYTTRLLAESSYRDAFDDYLAFLAPRLEHAHRLLAREGTLYFHIDYREAHHCKLLLDEIFGRECFLNELIWAYDYGARSRRRWPSKHDTILVYVRDRDAYFFDAEAVDREPYMAPGLVTPEKVARGKLPTDVWWHTIVPTNGAEKTGYPTQKPEGIHPHARPG
jgi:site-specific DNA-methyltransferase (adenine-specific)